VRAVAFNGWHSIRGLHYLEQLSKEVYEFVYFVTTNKSTEYQGAAAGVVMRPKAIH
jgi:hypothetical protein